MIDPFKITNFERSEEEAQEFLLFALSVAGKTAVVISKAVDNFLQMASQQYANQSEKVYGNTLPFNLITLMKEDNTLEYFIKESKLGKHKVLTKGFSQLPKIDVKTATIDQLEEICGCGEKTSRFFL